MKIMCDCFLFWIKSLLRIISDTYLDAFYLHNWKNPLQNGLNYFELTSSFRLLVRGTFDNSPQNLPCYHKRELLH